MPARRAPSTALGVVVALAAIAATTLAIYPLREHAPVVSTGVLYLLAVLLVATLWGLRLGLLTALAGALAFNYFHIPPTGRLTVASTPDAVALAVFLATAVAACAVAELARRRREEAERRREEADLAAELARVLLGGQTTARGAARRLRAPRRGARRPLRRDRARRGRRAPGRRAPRRARASRARRIRPALAALLAAARRARPPPRRGRRDAGAAALGRDQDRAAAGGLARPAHAADGDRRRRRGGPLAGDLRTRARRARRGRSPRRPTASAG